MSTEDIYQEITDIGTLDAGWIEGARTAFKDETGEYIELNSFDDIYSEYGGFPEDSLPVNTIIRLFMKDCVYFLSGKYELNEDQTEKLMSSIYINAMNSSFDIDVNESQEFDGIDQETKDKISDALESV